jgi:hypothetical protein
VFPRHIMVEIRALEWVQEQMRDLVIAMKEKMGQVNRLVNGYLQMRSSGEAYFYFFSTQLLDFISLYPLLSKKLLQL